MKALIKTVATVLIVIALTSFPAAVLFSGQVRNSRDHADCLQDRKTYDVLHKLIAQAGQPSAVPLSRRLVLPMDTPQWFRDVLVQLAETSDPRSLDPFFAILGRRPSC